MLFLASVGPQNAKPGWCFFCHAPRRLKIPPTLTLQMRGIKTHAILNIQPVLTRLFLSSPDEFAQVWQGNKRNAAVCVYYFLLRSHFFFLHMQMQRRTRHSNTPPPLSALFKKQLLLRAFRINRVRTFRQIFIPGQLKPLQILNEASNKTLKKGEREKGVSHKEKGHNKITSCVTHFHQRRSSSNRPAWL